MAYLKIILLCILSAVVYGILHDQVTARVCIEYFTVGHDPIFPTTSPTLLAICWGTFATWWVGLILGVIAALTSRVGRWPKLDAANLIKPIVCLLIVVAIASLLAGITGYQLAKDSGQVLPEPYGARVPKDHHHAFFADSLAHLAAYVVGGVGGLILCIRILIQRHRLAKTAKEDGKYTDLIADPWIVFVSRWTARIISIPLLALVVILILGDGIANPLTASTRDNLLGLTILIMLLGLILGWKWEGLGGLLILAGLALFAIVNRGLLLNIVIAPWLFAGVAYLLCWWRQWSVRRQPI